MSSKASISQNNKSGPFTAQGNSKRTRSQLPHLNFDLDLQRSPLKDARQATRKANREPDAPNDGGVDAYSMTQENSICKDTPGEDEILLSPRKRASSPSAESSGQADPKRPKRDAKGPLPALFARQFAKLTPKQPERSSGLAHASTSRVDVVPFRPPATFPSAEDQTRGAEDSGIPLQTPSKPRLQNIPHLDLAAVTPARWKGSPAKKSRAVSEGSLSHIADGTGSVILATKSGLTGEVDAKQLLKDTYGMDIVNSPTRAPDDLNKLGDEILIKEIRSEDLPLGIQSFRNISSFATPMAQSQAPFDYVVPTGGALSSLRAGSSKAKANPSSRSVLRDALFSQPPSPLTPLPPTYQFSTSSSPGIDTSDAPPLADPTPRRPSALSGLMQPGSQSNTHRPVPNTQPTSAGNSSQTEHLSSLALLPLTPLPPSMRAPFDFSPEDDPAGVGALSLADPTPTRPDGQAGDALTPVPTPGPIPSRLPRLSLTFPHVLAKAGQAHAGPSGAPAETATAAAFEKAAGSTAAAFEKAAGSTAAQRRTKPLSSGTTAPLTRAAALREKERVRQIQQLPRMKTRRAASVQPQPLLGVALPATKPVSTSGVRKGSRVVRRGGALARLAMCPPVSPGPGRSAGTAAGPSRAGSDGEEQQPPLKRRKSFVLTLPSSLSPSKRATPADAFSSSSSSDDARARGALYPPPITDAATKARSQSTLSTLSNALEKLALPPPSRPHTRDDVRPATSMGFNPDIRADIFSPPAVSAADAKAGPAPASAEAGTRRTAGALGRSGAPSGVQTTMQAFLVPPGKGKERAFPPMRFAMGSAARGGRRPTFGVGGAFKRPFDKVSRKTSLGTVEGSPVKGGSVPAAVGGEGDDVATPVKNGSMEKVSDRVDTSAATEDHGSVILAGDSAGSKNAERWQSKTNASRRASMAYSTLSQSLSALPTADDDQPKRPSGPTRFPSSQRSTSAAFPSRALTSGISTSFTSMSTPASSFKQEAGAGPSTAPAAIGGSDSEAGSSRGSGGHVKRKASNRTKMPGSLDVLQDCTIFVDVRTEEGEDAGALFVDMLRGLGAKVLTRVGQTCTHIVYKNGLASTLTRYRLLDEPRPSVIGIGWVVACVEKRERMDEARYQVDLDCVNVSGTNKRRRSMLPRQMLMAGAHEEGGQDDVLVDSSFDDSLTSDGDNSRKNTSASSLQANLAPLEKARQRSIMISRP